MPYLHDVISEFNEFIRVHHASGHFARETAMARLVANGLSLNEANAVLDQPVDPALFDEYKTWPLGMRPTADT